MKAGILGAWSGNLAFIRGIQAEVSRDFADDKLEAVAAYHAVNKL